MLIGDSTPEYLVIRTAIVVLRGIAPLSIAYCVVLPILSPGTFASLPWLPLSVWAAAETAFAAVDTLLHAHVQDDAPHPQPPTRAVRDVVFQRCLDTVRDPLHFLRGWFLGSPLEDIGHTDCLEFYAWSLLNKQYHQITRSERRELEDYVARLEQRLGHKLPSGRRGARSLRGTLDAVPVQHRPLVWYSVVGFVDLSTSLRLLFSGFKFHPQPVVNTLANFPFRPLAFFGTRGSTSGHLSYWYRKHTSQTKLPILFIHGIGVGLYTYTGFLQQLAHGRDAHDDGEVGIVAIEILPISARICQAALSPAEMKAEILRIIDDQGWNEFILAGHSFGTGISATFLRDLSVAPRIRGAVLMDPICFMLHLPDVAYNFTRRRPSKASERMLYYFSSQDLRISHTIARRFFWSEFILWTDDLPADLPVSVILSADDIIVPVKEVWWYLTGGASLNRTGPETKDVSEWERRNRKVTWIPRINHAGLFASAAFRRAAAREVLTLSRQDAYDRIEVETRSA